MLSRTEYIRSNKLIQTNASEREILLDISNLMEKYFTNIETIDYDIIKKLINELPIEKQEKTLAILNAII